MERSDRRVGLSDAPKIAIRAGARPQTPPPGRYATTLPTEGEG